MQTGVIFDMDGVLVDSGPAHAESWRMVAARDRIEVSNEQFKRLFGMPSRDIVRVIWGAGLSDEEVRRHDDQKEAAYRDLIAGNVPLTPGVRPMLESLRDSGLVLAVATSGPRENVELVLREGEIGSFFSTIVTGFDITHGKPAPDCFLLAAERIDIEPKNCVVVEDAPVGIQAALAANMPVIGLIGTHPAERLRDAGATAIVEELSEITPDTVSKLLLK